MNMRTTDKQKLAESISISNRVETEIEQARYVLKLRFLDRRSGYQKMNVKRVLQACTYDEKGNKQWEDIPVVKE